MTGNTRPGEDDEAKTAVPPSRRGRMLEAALRQDLSSFIRKTFGTVVGEREYRHNWHIEALAWHLQQCLFGDIKRLIITLPPRNLKSIAASVAFPAWALGHDPSLRIICASYAAELMTKHARDCRSVMQSDWYRGIFPRTRIAAAKNTETEFMTTRKGYRLGTSIGGTLTGRGGNLIIIDDPIKPADANSEAARAAFKQWYSGTLFSRLDDKATDCIILVMQRLHVDDPVAYVMEWGDWVHLNLPAIAPVTEEIEIGLDRHHLRRAGDLLHPERENQKTLDSIKAEIGSFYFNAQYQQQPEPPGGNMIKWDWFNFYDDLPLPNRQQALIVQSWDTAMKGDQRNDYSVCITALIDGDDCYLIDVMRQRLEYPDLKRRCIELEGRHKPRSLLIEDKGSGTSLIQDLKQVDGIRKPRAVKPEGDKITRMSHQSARIEARQVYLPREAPWLDEFRKEIMAFPESRFDDQVDSLSQLLWWVGERRRHRAYTVDF